MIINVARKQPYIKSSIEQINMLSTDGDEMALSEHIEEFSQRVVFCIINRV